MEKVKQMEIPAVGGMMSLEHCWEPTPVAWGRGEDREGDSAAREHHGSPGPVLELGGEHCSVLASASLLAAWSLDLLPIQVKWCCLA